MSSALLEKQIQALPEDCLEEVSHYIEYILFRRKTTKDTNEKKDLSVFFGCLKNLSDGMDFQRGARDEWD